MEDVDLLGRITSLVAEERELRRHWADGQALSDTDQVRMLELEQRLDQCWDLLRQRRAHREWGQDPAAAHERPARQVESYLQ